MGSVDMLQNTLGCGVVPLRGKLRGMGTSCRAAGWVRKLLRGFLRPRKDDAGALFTLQEAIIVARKPESPQ